MGYASAFNEPAKSKRSMTADLARVFGLGCLTA